MNAMIRALSHGKTIPFLVMFKAVFGCGIGSVILVGAFFYLAGADFTPIVQIGAGFVGAVAGGVGAYRVYTNH